MSDESGTLDPRDASGAASTASGDCSMGTSRATAVLPREMVIASASTSRSNEERLVFASWTVTTRSQWPGLPSGAAAVLIRPR